MTLISRRTFLRAATHSACSAIVLGMLPGIRRAFAEGGNGTKLLFINMNGGWDGLSLCQPKSGAVFNALSALRPTLKSAPEQLLSLSPEFGLHTSLNVCKALFDAGELGIIHNVGYLNMSRSHQDAEYAFARGVDDRLSPQASGFINRLGFQYQWSSALRAVSVNGADPMFSGGQYTGLQVNGLEQYRFITDDSQTRSENLDRQATAYGISQQWSQDPSKPLQKEISHGFDIAVNTSETVHDVLGKAGFVEQYPSSYLARSLKDIDVLFSSGALGTEVGYVRRVGFDTHSNQTSVLTPLLNEFDSAFGTFVKNMKAKGIWNNLIVVVMSEFGRTNKENGSAGTDHGGAVPCFVAGGKVRGGNIWGGISVSDLNDNGWLPMQYNVAELYGQVLTQMGYDRDKVVKRTGGAGLEDLFKS